MKILQSEGRSYTSIQDKKLKRGVLGVRHAYQVPEELVKDGTVSPADLATYIGKEPALALRQTISCLDKTIKKPHRLGAYSSDVYVQRVKLAEALRTRLFKKFEETIRKNKGQHGIDMPRQSWDWKAHPYAVSDVIVSDPTRDKNWEMLKRIEKKEARDHDADRWKGRWYKAFTQSGDQTDLNWDTVAKNIDDHLWSQEIMINGKMRLKEKKPTEKGLIHARGETISNSSSDPRAPRNPLKAMNWTSVEENHYFHENASIAKDIREGVIQLLDAGDRVHKNFHGSIIYDHFGHLQDRTEPKGLDMKNLWNLHNHVRHYYQQLLKSERFKRACREYDADHIRKILPRDNAHLLRIFKGRDENADLSNLIRLGKLIVHASDLPHETTKEKTQDLFQKRLDYFASSDGQSEIKRNESFNRVWRNSVSLTSVSLSTWLDPNYNIDGDIFSDSRRKVINDLNGNNFRNHAKVILGQERSKLLIDGNDADDKETAWSLLSIAAELRNRVNHFATKDWLVDIVKDGIVKPKENPRVLFNNRGNGVVSEAPMTRLMKLLNFDLELNAKSLADKLNQIKATAFLNKGQLDKIKESCSHLGLAPVPIPNFTKMARQLRNLVNYNPKDGPALVPELGELGAGFKDEKYSETFLFKSNLLRLIYTSHFSEWLNRIDQNIFEDVISDVCTAQKYRRQRFNKESRKFYAVVSDMVEDLQLESCTDLVSLISELTAQMAREERLNQSYSPNQEKQSQVSNLIDKFKLELFGHLFARFLRDHNLSWLAKFKLTTEPVNDATPIAPGDITRNDGFEPEQWHANFYAWLYLLPTDKVALLKNQFEKTEVLEGKGSTSEGREDRSQDINTLGRLMALYVSVYDTGFSGTEPIVPEDRTQLFYQKTETFKRVFDNDDHSITLAGSHRGLRRLRQFGHLKVLSGIFEKHAITDTEVDLFCKLAKPENNQAIIEAVTNRAAKRKKVLGNIEQYKNPALKSDERESLKTEIIAQAQKYKEAAEKMAIHDFAIRAGRLQDQARLGHLLMSIIGRLLDYTLLWERDSQYAYLGMLARQIGIENLKIQKQSGDASEIGLDLTNMQQNITFLALWRAGHGFALPKPPAIRELLDNDRGPIFDRYFGTSQTENPRDVASNEDHIRNKEQRRKTAFSWGKAKIRNDFAHYNVLREQWNRNKDDKDSRSRIDLTYLINATRSLVAYDRKLKNAVSKSIEKILLDENLTIEWTLKEDRLKKAQILPQIETHLAMARKIGDADLRFVLPQASPRFTSMAQALFKVSNSGNLGEFDEGRARYPGKLFSNVQDMGLEMPRNFDR